jgi:Rad3-related DNA helicase
VITEEQVRLNIFKKNLVGSPFDFRFQAMQHNPSGIYNQLIDTIFEISKLVPHGMLVICPNFRTLR